MDKRKIWFIAVSIVFLGLFLRRDYVKNIWDPTVMSVEVVSPEEVAIQKQKLTFVEIEPQILYNDVPITYEKGTNTLYITQNINKKEWSGILKQ